MNESEIGDIRACIDDGNGVENILEMCTVSFFFNIVSIKLNQAE